jgi:transcriptional regulator with XRE-family HTH domain
MDLSTSMAAKRSGTTSLHVDVALRNVLGTNLRTARLDAGLTQRQLGDLAGVSRDYIGQIENSTANVSIDLLASLARNLGTTPIKLMTQSKKDRGP